MPEYAVMPKTDYKDACDAIREKTGGIARIKSGELGGLIRGIQSGGSGDGSVGGGSGSSDSKEDWIGDGNTHIWISLAEGRTSPMLGCCPNGTVTVYWGDGTTPDVLTGTDTTVVAWTPTHNYAAAGDYVITLTVDGKMSFYGSSSYEQHGGILRYSSSDDIRNRYYRGTVQKIEVGDNVVSIGSYAFGNCRGLTSITISNSVTSIESYAFYDCHSLTSVTLPDSLTSIANRAFQNCHSLPSITIPESVTNIEQNAFNNCYVLTSITIPDSLTSIAKYALQGCYKLPSVTIPESVTSIEQNAFNYCYSLTSITIPAGVTSIGTAAFGYLYGLRKFCFEPATPPTVGNSDAFRYLPTDCIISVPVGSLEVYTTATNYPDPATYTYIEED